MVRLESPGRNFEVEKALLAAGADEADAVGPSRIGRQASEQLVFDKGRLWYPRQWYLGFTHASCGRLEKSALARCPPHVLTTPTADVEILFDKDRCQERFARHGIPVPRGLGPVHSFEELYERMRATGCRRVFVKLSHGSSASGVVAYQTSGSRQQALTTVEMVHKDGELRLYNSRRIRRYDKPGEIAELIDVLGARRRSGRGVDAKGWTRRAHFRSARRGDRGAVAACRGSDEPEPDDEPALVESPRRPVGRARPDGARRLASRPPDLREQAAAVFPGSLHLGVDLLIRSDFRRHAVLEGNAFGDLLPNVLSEGEDVWRGGNPGRNRPKEWRPCVREGLKPC